MFSTEEPQDFQTMLAQAQQFQEIRRMFPVREHDVESLGAWRDKGRPLGHFLTAVLEGDLFEAINRADSYNMLALPSIAIWIVENLPTDSYGSKSAVKEWYNARHT